MRRRRLVSLTAGAAGLAPLAAACGGTAAGGAAAPAGGTPGAAAGGRKTATIELDKGGAITLELFPQLAPKWVDNFVQKANAGFYNGLTFHRVEDWVVQGGDPRGNGTGGGNIPTELNERPFAAGSVGVARGPDIRVSNDAQFFIITKAAPPELGGKWVQLDKQYTNFGQVTEGMDIVRRVQIGDKIKRITIKG
jgi:peptidyl-prolyl cis-trans isomerase B (cyclophilin B)